MKMLQEFKEFAIKGNMMDMAVGIIIGAAFSGIVSSLVKDVIMPVATLIVGKDLDFTNLYVVLGPIPEGVANTYQSLKDAGVPLLAYGNFITVLLNFIILAFLIFMLVKAMNNLRRKHQESPQPTVPKAEPEDIVLLREIRDSLKKS